jgi:hypothetical protein
MGEEKARPGGMSKDMYRLSGDILLGHPDKAGVVISLDAFPPDLEVDVPLTMAFDPTRRIGTARVTMRPGIGLHVEADLPETQVNESDADFAIGGVIVRQKCMPGNIQVIEEMRLTEIAVVEEGSAMVAARWAKKDEKK